MLSHGIYEQVINKKIEQEIEAVPLNRKEVKDLDEAEAGKILARYLVNIVEKGMDNLLDKGGKLSDQIALANQIVRLVQDTTQEDDFNEFSIDIKAKQLLALLRENDPMLILGKSARDLPRPETSIAQSSLFTGALYEPQMYSELKKEILSADRIDMLVSFIKWSGLRLIMEELKEFTNNGGQLRVITTSYMGATDIKAVEELEKLLNTQIKVSYDTKRTRLHAKSYVFYRNNGFTTAYVGSSNLSNAAISNGLEWNVKITRYDLPDTIEKIGATFESYWNSKEFEAYTAEMKDKLSIALKGEKYHDNNLAKYMLDINPYAYQQEILDKLQTEREIRGYYKNLVVAATGTGKTVISAFEYRNFCQKNKELPCRLLFVAHREEILLQSLYTFRAILKDPNFGEVFVGNYRPASIDKLFISIQTFNSQEFIHKTDRDFYDYIIIDEAHHVPSNSYQNLLSYYTPKILLGLTATPERMDGKNVLSYFNSRIAAEIRLPEAIDRKLLCPFQYFGVTDTVDLSSLTWSRGGYDKQELNNIYTFSGAVARRRANLIVSSVFKYVTDIDAVRALGFCVSLEHGRFMSDYFNAQGVPSMFLSGDSPKEERKNAKVRLAKGEIKFIFVVDLYNEGVDIPEINTILFLRPTESLTVFLQQLGRGLRLAEGKECLTVLDFIGQANKRYNFSAKFSALLPNSSKGIVAELKNGYISAPRGSYIILEKKAQEYILTNIRATYGNTAALVEKIAAFTEESGLKLTLENFFNFHQLNERSLYKFATFSRLCVRAGCLEDFRENLEDIITKAMVKLSYINSREWINFLLDFLPHIKERDFTHFTLKEQRMLQMLYVTIWNKVEPWASEAMKNNLYLLAENKILLAEMLALLKYRLEKIDFIDESLKAYSECPLALHCTYTRDQILVALDFMKPASVREGVKWLADKGIDILFVTLNKSDKDYSPSTMYKDYSINEELFHWQSQSLTADTSNTGRRYINHKKLGSQVLLFVREFKNDDIAKNMAAAYTCLGRVNYSSHQGSKPMNIIWQLERPIPAKFMKKTNKLII